MRIRIALPIAIGLLMVAAGPSPASTKPCRDKDGKVVPCPKPPRKPSPPRCKDDKGRFVACPAEGKAAPGPGPGPG